MNNSFQKCESSGWGKSEPSWARNDMFWAASSASVMPNGLMKPYSHQVQNPFQHTTLLGPVQYVANSAQDNWCGVDQLAVLKREGITCSKNLL
jgi:hypothetical protein